MDTDVCHGHRRVSLTQRCVMDTDVCHGHRGVSWTQTCVMDTEVCHGHRGVSLNLFGSSQPNVLIINQQFAGNNYPFRAIQSLPQNY